MSTTLRLSHRAEWAEGQPISELMSRALAEPDLISLAAGFVDEHTLPVDPTREALASMFADGGGLKAALQYGTTSGYPALREAILSRFVQTNACQRDLSIDQVVVTAGSNQLLHLVSESLLDPGDIVLCSAPTYFVYLGTLGNAGALSYGVAVDAHGMVPEALEDSLTRLQRAGDLPRVKAIYLVPYSDNPCGITMPLERCARIVDIAKRWSLERQIHVIADEAYREMRYEGEDVPSVLTVDDEGDTVIVAGTFSKSFSPGIRVGWGILPQHLIGPVCNQKGNIDFGSPNFSQHLMASVMQLGLYEPHLERVRAGYRRKLQAMLAAVDHELAPIGGVRWITPTGGLYVWLQLTDDLPAGPDGPLFNAAIAEGVLYVPGQYCYPTLGEPVRHNTVRLSFGVQTPEKIRQGVAALARSMRHVLG
ncbi:MAG: PLP-dependent aminotransferase family protein [Planctomycetes bacterium]|nr:PLP-dependent aminotransferase family protein [Planctomycetota bacterium]